MTVRSLDSELKSSQYKNPEIINEITQGVSAWSEKKSKSKENIIHPEA